MFKCQLKSQHHKADAGAISNIQFNKLIKDGKDQER